MDLKCQYACQDGRGVRERKSARSDWKLGHAWGIELRDPSSPQRTMSWLEVRAVAGSWSVHGELNSRVRCCLSQDGRKACANKDGQKCFLSEATSVVLLNEWHFSCDMMASLLVRASRHTTLSFPLEVLVGEDDGDSELTSETSN